MTEIKEYSSIFASKLAYIMSLKRHESKAGLVTSLSECTCEKPSTTRNWLFNGRVPREPKQLQVADSLGVSEEYLFDDNINVKDLQGPIISKREGYYLIPFFDEEELFSVNNQQIIPVHHRIPFMLPNIKDSILKFGKKIYATKLKQSNFLPQIEPNSIVICSSNILLEDYRFVLVDSKPLQIKRVIEVDGKFKLLSYDHMNHEMIESIPPNQSMLIVILAYTL